VSQNKTDDRPSSLTRAVQLTVDPNGRIVEAVAEAATLFQITAQDLLGTPFADAIDDSERGAFAGDPATWAATRYEQATTLVTRAGARIPAMVIARPIASLVTVEPRWSLLVAPLAPPPPREADRAHRALVARMAALGTLAHGIGHELNNPLAVIQTNLDYAAIELGDQQRSPFLQANPAGEAFAHRLSSIASALDEARLGTTRIRKIMRDLRTIAQADHEMAGPISLGTILESTLTLLGPEITDRTRVVTDIDALPNVQANEAQLAQVMLALVLEACTAATSRDRPDPEVRVTCRAQGDVLVTRISDNGPGMTDDQLAHVFEPFAAQQVRGVASGLGLSVCNAFVTSMGGAIEVHSSLGAGATFTVTLPVTQRAAPNTRRKRAPAGRRGRVLCVDDETLVLSALRRALGAQHELATVGSASEALALIASGHIFDLVLSDLMMPGMSGMDFYAKLQELSPEHAARTVFMTGGVFAPGAREFLASVPNPRIEKPFELTLLRSLVQSWVEQRGAGESVAYDTRQTITPF